jgi:sodium/hydrogen exchanger 8
MGRSNPPLPPRLLLLLLLLVSCWPMAALGNTESGAHRQESATWEMLASLLVLMTSLFLTHALLLSKFHVFPESVATIFLGFIIGAYLHYNSKEISFLISFDPKTFFIYLLPAIIFDAGYSLHKAKFFSLLGSILAFAVFGTLVSSLAVGTIIYYAGIAGFSAPLPLSHALAFGSLISSVDPVATLAIFNSVNLSSTLYMLVFGESVLNDAVAVVLFKSFSMQSDAEHADIYSAIVDFVDITVFSVGVGMTTALFSALLFKYSRVFMFPVLECSMMVVLCYLPYLLAEALALSGIVAILTAAVIMSHYTHANLSPITQVCMAHLSRLLGKVAETVVFAYLGMSAFIGQHTWHLGFTLTTIVAILIGRALNVFPIAWLLNRHARLQLSWQEQTVMWFSGLRGAISYCLATNAPSASLLAPCTLAVVLITTVFFGGGTMPFVRYMGVEGRPSLSRQSSDEELQAKAAAAGSELRLRRSVPDGEQGKADAAAAAARAQPLTDGEDREGEGVAAAPEGSWFQRLDNNFLSPLFRISAVERERQNLIVSSFQSECALGTTGHQGSASAAVAACACFCVTPVAGSCR